MRTGRDRQAGIEVMRWTNDERGMTMLTFDNSGAMAALDELDDLLSDAKLAPEQIESIFKLFDDTSQLFRVVPNVDAAPAGGAPGSTICFEPSERLGNVLAALRAGEVDRLFIGHV